MRKYDYRNPKAGVIIQITILGICLAAAFLLLLFSIQKWKKADSKPGEAVETGVLTGVQRPAETEKVKAEREFTVDGISVTGLSKDEAKEKILKSYPWNMRLSYRDSAVELENPLPELLDHLLTEIYGQDESLWLKDYELDMASLEGSIRAQVASAASKWNRSPSSAQLTGRDKEKGSWIYSDGENGIRIDQEAAVREIMSLFAEKKFTASIEVQAEAIAPELSAGEAKERYQVIGTFSTTAANNSNRNNNIRLAVEALDGLVIFPGEEFSFNRATGNRTTERGYLPAGAYRNGEFVEEPGGGVCQVSSTLYNAVIFSGIKTTERNPHSFEPSYVIPGEDAMVSYDGYSGPDLRFVNTQETSVAIRAVFEGKKLSVSIIGVPILEEGMEITMRSQKTKEYDPPTPKYEEDQTLQPGQEITVQEGVKGTTWKTWLVTSKDGTVIEEEYFHTSTYKGKPGVAKRNTTGVVIPVPTESETGAEMEAETGAEMGEDEAEGETVPGSGENVNGETLPVESLPTETLPAETPGPDGASSTERPGPADVSSAETFGPADASSAETSGPDGASSTEKSGTAGVSSAVMPGTAGVSSTEKP